LQQYLLKRLALVIPTLLGITLVVSLSVRFLPGSIVDQLLGEEAGLVDPETRAAMEERFGLNQTPVEQYIVWVTDLGQGDLGRSLISGRAITNDLRTRVPVTFQLGLMGLAIAVLIAIPVGVISAIRQDTAVDYVARSFAIVLLSTPSFWIGLIAIVYGFILFGWTPPLAYSAPWESLSGNLRSLWVPALILGTHATGTIMRITRATMLETLRQDYVRTAWSKGLRERVVVTRHALKNAILPVITVIGLQVPSLVGGTVILERIFSIPGMGNYLLTAIQQRDYPVVQAVVLVTSFVVVFSNLFVDLAYAVIDPRIRLS
jgi:peptide/nickel transport system permease protein